MNMFVSLGKDLFFTGLWLGVNPSKQSIQHLGKPQWPLMNVCLHETGWKHSLFLRQSFTQA